MLEFYWEVTLFLEGVFLWNIDPLWLWNLRPASVIGTKPEKTDDFNLKLKCLVALVVGILYFRCVWNCIQYHRHQNGLPLHHNYMLDVISETRVNCILTSPPLLAMFCPLPHAHYIIFLRSLNLIFVCPISCVWFNTIVILQLLLLTSLVLSPLPEMAKGLSTWPIEPLTHDSWVLVI